MCGRLFWGVSNFRPFLRFTGRADLVETAGLAGVKRSHRILPVLGDDDQARVVHACSSGLVNARLLLDDPERLCPPALPALVTTKLADYVLGERPGAGDDHVLLRSKAPHTRLAGTQPSHLAHNPLALP